MGYMAFVPFYLRSNISHRKIGAVGRVGEDVPPLHLDPLHCRPALVCGRVVLVEPPLLGSPRRAKLTKSLGALLPMKLVELREDGEVGVRVDGRASWNEVLKYTAMSNVIG